MTKAAEQHALAAINRVVSRAPDDACAESIQGCPADLRRHLWHNS